MDQNCVAMRRPSSHSQDWLDIKRLHYPGGWWCCLLPLFEHEHFSYHPRLVCLSDLQTVSKGKLLFINYPVSGIPIETTATGDPLSYDPWLPASLNQPQQLEQNTLRTRDQCLKQPVSVSHSYIGHMSMVKVSAGPISGVKITVTCGMKRAIELSGILPGRHQCHLHTHDLITSQSPCPLMPLP